MAIDIWSFIFTLFGLAWVMPKSVVELWSIGKDGFNTIERRRCDELCLYVSCGICRKKETSGSLMELHPPYVIKEHILQTLHDWHSMSFLDFIDSLFLSLCDGIL